MVMALHARYEPMPFNRLSVVGNERDYVAQGGMVGMVGDIHVPLSAYDRGHP